MMRYFMLMAWCLQTNCDPTLSSITYIHTSQTRLTLAIYNACLTGVELPMDTLEHGNMLVTDEHF